MDALSVIAAALTVAMMAITASLFSPDVPAGPVAYPGSAAAQHTTAGR